MTNVSDQIERSTVVLATLSDVYNMWANFENFPLFMPRLKSVTKTGEASSHWVMEGPLGTDLEWEAQTTAMESNRRIAWSSLPGSTVTTSGQVSFRELGPNETEVTVRMGYDLTGGPVVETAAQVLSNPEDVVQESLRRFKEHMEHTAERLHPGDTKRSPGAANPPDGPTGPAGPIGDT
jgi:uncharacterized membrane protein